MILLVLTFGVLAATVLLAAWEFLRPREAVPPNCVADEGKEARASDYGCATYALSVILGATIYFVAAAEGPSRVHLDRETLEVSQRFGWLLAIVAITWPWPASILVAELVFKARHGRLERERQRRYSLAKQKKTSFRTDAVTIITFAAIAALTSVAFLQQSLEIDNRATRLSTWFGLVEETVRHEELTAISLSEPWTRRRRRFGKRRGRSINHPSELRLQSANGSMMTSADWPTGWSFDELRVLAGLLSDRSNAPVRIIPPPPKAEP